MLLMEKLQCARHVKREALAVLVLVEKDNSPRIKLKPVAANAIALAATPMIIHLRPPAWKKRAPSATGSASAISRM